MSERFLCRICGECAPLPYEALCRACATVGESMPALGHSIARFARAAEVDALVMEITGHAVEMSSGLPWYRLNHVGRAHRDKLLRLAQLARDGGRNG